MNPDEDEPTAFDRSAGEGCAASPVTLIDFAHLAKQTMGDHALQREVLGLFAEQAASVAERIGRADREERRRLAHRLKGAARGVGAGAIAECLEELEEHPQDAAVLDRFERLVWETRELIASINLR